MSDGMTQLQRQTTQWRESGNRCNEAWYKHLNGAVVQLQVQVKIIIKLPWVELLLPTL